MRTVLYGTKGTIIVNNTDPVLELYRLHPDGSAVLTKLPLEIDNHNVMEEHRLLREAVLNGAPLITTGAEGARTVAVCRAVVESAETGKPVEIVYPV
jgi:predicted dehydrogenase